MGHSVERGTFHHSGRRMPPAYTYAGRKLHLWRNSARLVVRKVCRIANSLQRTHASYITRPIWFNSLFPRDSYINTAL